MSFLTVAGKLVFVCKKDIFFSLDASLSNSKIVLYLYSISSRRGYFKDDSTAV